MIYRKSSTKNATCLDNDITPCISYDVNTLHVENCASRAGFEQILLVIPGLVCSLLLYYLDSLIQSMSIHVYPCLSMSIHVYPCLSMSIHVYPCISTAICLCCSLTRGPYRILPSYPWNDGWLVIGGLNTGNI